MNSSAKEWWWLAVHGPACEVCPIPMSIEKLRVSPVPEHLIGFQTMDEQLAAQKFILTSSETDVRDFIAALAALNEAGHLTYIRPDDPDPMPLTQAEKAFLWRPRKIEIRRTGDLFGNS